MYALSVAARTADVRKVEFIMWSRTSRHYKMNSLLKISFDKHNKDTK